MKRYLLTFAVVSAVLATNINKAWAACNNDGTCDAGETTADCVADCPATTSGDVEVNFDDSDVRTGAICVGPTNMGARYCIGEDCVPRTFIRNGTCVMLARAGKTIVRFRGVDCDDHDKKAGAVVEKGYVLETGKVDDASFADKAAARWWYSNGRPMIGGGSGGGGSSGSKTATTGTASAKPTVSAVPPASATTTQAPTPTPASDPIMDSLNGLHQSLGDVNRGMGTIERGIDGLKGKVDETAGRVEKVEKTTNGLASDMKGVKIVGSTGAGGAVGLGVGALVGSSVLSGIALGGPIGAGVGLIGGLIWAFASDAAESPAPASAPAP